MLVVVEVDQTTLLVEVLVVEHLVAMEQMVAEQEKVAHNLQVVLLDLFKQVELQDLHFKEDLVPVAAEVRASSPSRDSWGCCSSRRRKTRMISSRFID